MSERIAKVEIWKLEVRDQKHRLKLDIVSLAESILLTGQINPITVKKVSADRYRVISGRRRYSALKYIQEELHPEKKIKALVYIKDIDALREELIKIDENIMRQALDDVELDESIYRRKQIYEELHPDTKQRVAGGVARHGEKTAPAFTQDAARSLNISRRTIEKAVSRAARASDSVKKARAQGLNQSKVDMLVSFEPKDQDILLPYVKEMDLAESKALMDATRKHGAKAAVLYLEEKGKEDPALRPLLREAARFLELVESATQADLVFRGEGKHQNVKLFETITQKIGKFLSIQKAEMGYLTAIKRGHGGERKLIRAARG
jgi:ParB family chromosome partitioning protein